jgi:hypothetical protein
MEVRLRGKSVVEVTLADGIEFDIPTAVTRVGERSSALKLIEIRDRDAGTVEIRTEVRPGMSYRIRARADKQLRVSGGGEIVGEESGWKLISVKIPAQGDDEYVDHLLLIQMGK